MHPRDRRSSRPARFTITTEISRPAADSPAGSFPVILSLLLPLQKAGKKDNALFLSPLAGLGKPGDARRGRGKEVTSALSTWLQFQSHTASGKSTLKREREKKRVFVEVGGGHSKGGKEGPAADHRTGTLTIGSGRRDDFHL